jgi:subtilisin family serine protease
MTLAWSEAFEPDRIRPFPALPLPQPTSEWAHGGSDGRGVRVAVVDSGIDRAHPMVGAVTGGVVFEPDDDSPGGVRVEEREHDDLAGHGTAVAGIIRSLAPACDLWSLRVLGENMRGRAAVFAAAVEWATQRRFDVVNLSLSTSNDAWFGRFHALADAAYFAGSVLVCAVNNVPAPTYPSQFASVVSVASSGAPGSPVVYNVDPPAEFGAPGLDVPVAWPGGGTATVTGNSFAAPYVAGLVALIRSKHPGLPCHSVKAVLAAVSVNARHDATSGEISAG